MTRNVRESEFEAMHKNSDKLRIELAERNEECEELRAHCERLREALTTLVSGVEDEQEELYNNYCDYANKALSETPVQSLREIRAEAVKEAGKVLMPAPPKPPDDPDPGFNGYCEAIAEVYHYADQIRRGEG